MNHENLHQRSAEHHKSSKSEASNFEKAQEHVEFGPEEVVKAEHERKTKLEHSREKIDELAIEPKLEFSKEDAPPLPPTKREKVLLYKQTLTQLQRELPKRSSRLFSRVIHQPSIERITETAGKTLFRPSLMLGASIGALLGGSLVYISAKHYGFELSGSEFMIFGLVGALAGLTCESLKTFWRKAH